MVNAASDAPPAPDALVVSRTLYECPSSSSESLAVDANTLEDVRAIIPARCYRRRTTRGLFEAGRDVLAYVLAVVALVYVRSVWLAIPIIVFAGLCVSAMFVVGHDAAHGALTPSKRLNRWTALALMLPSLHVRSAWEFGHNRVHHGFTVRQGTDFVWHPLTVSEYRAMSRLQRFRHRLEWSGLGSGLYYLREVWWNKMIRFQPPAKHVRAVRRDFWSVVVGTTFASATALALGVWRTGGLDGAAWMWTKLVVAPFLVFTQVIGWTVYVHHIGPDLAWHSAKRWTKFRAQMMGTTILRLPPAMNLFFHNIFVHVPHHVDMRIPCYELPRAARAIVSAFPEIVSSRRFRFRDYLATTKACKLYDFDTERWMEYGSAG